MIQETGRDEWRQEPVPSCSQIPASSNDALSALWFSTLTLPKTMAKKSLTRKH
jgi:hypothetical protein